ncbi:hypothetical protein Tco_0420506 [Tanacetum coccineum]
MPIFLIEQLGDESCLGTVATFGRMKGACGGSKEEPNFKLVLDALGLSRHGYLQFSSLQLFQKSNMHQLNSVYKHDTFYRFKMDKRKRFKLTLEIFRDIFKICPRVQGQDFDALSTDEEILTNTLQKARDDCTTLIPKLSFTPSLLKTQHNPREKAWDAILQGWTYLIKHLRFVFAKRTQIYGAHLLKSGSQCDENRNHLNRVANLGECMKVDSNNELDPMSWLGLIKKKMSDERLSEGQTVKTPSNVTDYERNNRLLIKQKGDEDKDMEIHTSQLYDKAAATLTEFELKKILIDKMDKSESYLESEQRQL